MVRRIGVSLIVFGILANEWLLMKVFSSDGALELSTRFCIRLFNVAAVVAGLWTYRYGPRLLAAKTENMQRQRVPIAVGLLLSAGSVLGTLACLEGICFYLNRRAISATEEGSYTNHFFAEDPVLGYKSNASTRVTALKKYEGLTLYDVAYTMDEYSRRVTPGQEAGARDKALLFFGDSFTFGEGVNDDETMPYDVAQAAPRYRVYNYGFVGYGPQQMLAKLETQTVRNEISAGRTVLVYTFIDDHVRRVIGSMVPFVAWAANAPYYRLRGNTLQRGGSFKTGRQIINTLYAILGRSQILKFFKIDLPPVITESHIRLTCKILEESRDQFQRQFGSDAFYVLLYPGATRASRLIPYLREAKIAYLDYSQLIDINEAYIPHEGHPTAATHRVIAAHLVEDLRLKDR